MADEPVTLAVVNARVWTGNTRRPWADAVAVRGDRIAAVGSSAEVKKLATPATRVIDAEGQLLVPGARPAVHDATRGTIERGQVADFVLLDGDVPPLPAELISQARVRLTVVSGRVTFERAARP